MTNSTITSIEPIAPTPSGEKASLPFWSRLSGFDFFEHCQSALLPKVFLASALIGFLGCSALGYASTQVNWFKKFQRFYTGISPSSNFYPTISEMKAIVHSRLKKNQVLVIVGGNSIFNGVGQPREKIWTDRLQKILGNDYCVINFALRGAYPFEGGYFAAESICREHPRTIYLTNAAPTCVGTPTGGDTYGYLYWQSLYRGEQLKDGERELTVSEYTAKLKDSEADKTIELKLRNQLDSLFYFSDLWNTVALKGFSTLWQAGPDTFGPRRRTQDVEPEPAPIVGRFKIVDIELKNIRAFSSPLFDKTPDGNWIPKDPMWKALDQDLQKIIPAPMKQHSLVLLVPNCPYYVKKLPADEQIRDTRVFNDARKHWLASGFECLVPNNLEEPDFFDRCHLTASGGAKLAELVAPEIVSLAHTLSEEK